MRRRTALVALALGWVSLAGCGSPRAGIPSLPFEPWQGFELAENVGGLVGLDELEDEFDLRYELLCTHIEKPRQGRAATQLSISITTTKYP